MPLKRRQFLSGSAGLTLAGYTGLAGLPFTLPATAAEVGGYRALVCLFLLGGLDCHDTILPFDQASYDEYAGIRSELLNQYGNIGGGSTRDRSRLLPLATSGDFGGREFALPEELAGIKGLYDAGNAAIVGNVGPLIVPVTRTEVLAETAPLPKRLFSHNDQQSTWASSAPEGAQFGWGGRFADAVLAAGGNSLQPEFSAVTTLADRLFVTGAQTVPYQVGVRGAARLQALEALQGARGTPEGEARYQLLREHYLAAGFSSSNLLSTDYQDSMAGALVTNELYDSALAAAPQLSTPFPQGNLGGQLGAVARSIAARQELGVTRQVFFVALGGFDTHSSQVLQLPALQREIDAAVVAFYAAMEELQIADQVTLFTASDFGRTLAVNGDGTDHGWAGHHFVVGQAVNGGAIYGSIPEATLGHSQDAGGGRLIPTHSVEQYAAPLGQWFGLNAAEVDAALPNLAGQGGSNLTFI
ncbi:MAG: DUF1501 domain-containing protein [Pseudomonadota bacterium]